MKLRRNLPLFFAIGAWIVFLWLHTVIYMVNYEGNAGIWGYLICALSMMIAAFLLAYCFLSFEELFPGGLFDDPDDEFFEDDSFFEEEDFTGCFLGKRAGKLFEVMSKGAEEEEFCLSMDTERPKSREEKTGTLQKSMTCVFVLAFVFFAALALERQTSFFDFYRDKTYIFAGFISINKEYLYDLILFLIFPFWVRIIFKGMEEEKFSCRSAALGGLQLAMLTIMQFLLFMEKSNVWMIELAAVDLLTVTAAVRSFVWKDIRRKGNAAAGVILYAGLWAGLLVLLHYPGQTLTQYTYAGNWAGYAKTVSRLLENAAAEPSFVLQTDQQIQELLFNHGNYLQSALYYWGWAAALAITVLLLVFLAAARKLLGKAKDSRNYLIYHAAWWSLAFRVLVGIPYSLGILPLPIGLPFAGETSLYMDTIAFALLIWCWRENKKAEAAHGGQAAGEKELEEETERPEKRGIRALPAVLAGVLVAAGLIGWNFTAKSAVRRIYPVNISINYTEGYSAMHALRGVKQLRCFTRYAENKSAGEICCL